MLSTGLFLMVSIMLLSRFLSVVLILMAYSMLFVAVEVAAAFLVFGL